MQIRSIVVELSCCGPKYWTDITIYTLSFQSWTGVFALLESGLSWFHKAVKVHFSQNANAGSTYKYLRTTSQELWSPLTTTSKSMFIIMSDVGPQWHMEVFTRQLKERIHGQQTCPGINSIGDWIKVTVLTVVFKSVHAHLHRAYCTIEMYCLFFLQTTQRCKKQGNSGNTMQNMKHTSENQLTGNIPLSCKHCKSRKPQNHVPRHSIWAQKTTNQKYTMIWPWHEHTHAHTHSNPAVCGCVCAWEEKKDGRDAEGRKGG